MFPTKKELMRAGRMDLVEAIKKRGGWYSLGWDDESMGDNVEETMDFDIGEFQRRVERCKESASLREHHSDSLSGDDKENGVSSEVNLSSGNLDSLQLTASASPGRSREIGADEDSGIEGILSRLEKQRNNDIGIDFEINFGKNGYEAHARSADEGDGRQLDTSLGVAAEISLSKDQVETDKESHRDGIFVSTVEDAEAWYKYEKINHNEIRTRLQHLECELTTALHSLRSKREECISEEVTGSSSDLQKLSDAWEFQENEFMSAKERLRSIKAKLAVLEGKMSLALINAQKIVETKQKQIDGAHKALQLLRTTCIVWPNSASEVLLAGSFDGWTTQRKMEKSKTGIFSLCLMLYPGRYEVSR
ncbi:hypothetical protein DH2020_003412 [Rehmannia glutinosa]|uniref:AMP-activated protein kinase glycogen-binding domain-containing protein n=1 Tax=Rehmannia glutinosa TaxID=99300 RepID=A0ABR0XLK6_REHGL